MAVIAHLRFPGGKAKAFTLSYDDAVESDFRLADLMRKHGVKGTFNVNSGVKRMLYNTPQPDLGEPRCRMNRDSFMRFFEKNRDIAEIAAHGLTHAYFTKMEQSAVTWEVIADRKNLEDWLGIPCRGFAYPYGVYHDESVEALACSGFLYARTTKSTLGFEIPCDPLRWGCTCHHKNPELMNLAEAFLTLNPEKDRAPYLFSVWGHSYEFNQDHNWELMENLLSLVGGRDDIWYPTNIEFFRYIKAYRSLEYFADQSAVYNPTAIPVTLSVMVTRSQPQKLLTVNPGETVRIVEE
ncbi:MAG: polysaccharide deacetylase family protein [Clostridia bacterium]|nr:polysaccharide deacetylase family protein [Clostridia bacterium]